VAGAVGSPVLPHPDEETNMAIDEARRHELHERARRALGVEAGDTLMEMLPPVGWADVATRRDIDATRDDIERLEAATKRDLDELRASMDLASRPSRSA
jgi:hypothetical protein